ncbi:hypothetical protein CEXT_365981 [Caerostris extrusa]|uniref:Uncharacterized protein n=1 Tax=Caerostris extrusa TaxID=172846 RepID=A0AAV4PJB4_CAEEX|nr:hypothetical protein CEXT_640021 [Caerostris extrusa]GIY50060.1 hypothetical protein CEXT_365981 [Caerostris extrusa]
MAPPRFEPETCGSEPAVCTIVFGNGQLGYGGSECHLGVRVVPPFVHILRLHQTLYDVIEIFGPLAPEFSTVHDVDHERPGE